MRYVDPDTWELRSATLREHAEGQIVGDALSSVHVMDACFSYTDIAGVPPVMQQLEGLANGLRYSSKAQHHGYLKDSDRFAIRMAQAVGATLNAEIDVAPPVAFAGDAVDAVMRFAEASAGGSRRAREGRRARPRRPRWPARWRRCGRGPSPSSCWRSSCAGARPWLASSPAPCSIRNGVIPWMAHPRAGSWAP